MATLRDKVQVVEASLMRYGGLYNFEDILDLIHRGEMQSFAHGDTWVVTQIAEFPRRRVLDIVLMVGSVSDLEYIEPKLEEFCKENGITAMFSRTRFGLERAVSATGATMYNHGWQRFATTYMKDIHYAS